MTVSMSTIRRFAYATLLAVTSLNFAPSLASAQDRAQGTFTLTHDVRWQNALVPAGEYRFSLNSGGVAGVLTLSQLTGARTGFMFVVRDTDEGKPTDRSRLVLETTPQGMYVSAMQLPGFGLTLHFAAPAQSAEKLAKVGTTVTLASAQ